MPINMGVFDGVKEAFGADGMGELSTERETPIDRWMGWNTKSVDSPQVSVGSKSTCKVVYYAHSAQVVAMTYICSPRPVSFSCKL